MRTLRSFLPSDIFARLKRRISSQQLKLEQCTYHGGLGKISLVIALSVLIGVGFAAYQVYKQPLVSDQQGQVTGNAQVSDWKTYRNEKYGFEFQYPRISESFSEEEWFAFDDGDYCVSFGPVSSRGGGFVWGICAYDPARFNRERTISEIGSQFADRKQNRTESTIAAVEALIVVTTTASYPEWVSKEVFIERNGRSFRLSNGAINNPDFDTALSTFKFTR